MEILTSAEMGAADRRFDTTIGSSLRLPLVMTRAGNSEAWSGESLNNR
jgi:hypothetical protein